VFIGAERNAALPRRILAFIRVSRPAGASSAGSLLPRRTRHSAISPHDHGQIQFPLVLLRGLLPSATAFKRFIEGMKDLIQIARRGSGGRHEARRAYRDHRGRRR
jgi:hypothetical protein